MSHWLEPTHTPPRRPPTPAVLASCLLLACLSGGPLASAASARSLCVVPLSSCLSFLICPPALCSAAVFPSSHPPFSHLRSAVSAALPLIPRARLAALRLQRLPQVCWRDALPSFLPVLLPAARPPVRLNAAPPPGLGSASCGGRRTSHSVLRFPLAVHTCSEVGADR